MKVLLTAPNIFTGIGGGETLYRNLIRVNPDIEFTILVPKLLDPADLPSNVSQLRMARRPHIYKLIELNSFTLEKEPFTSGKLSGSDKDAITNAFQIAESIKGAHFDLIDVPEYLIVGEFLRGALLHFNVVFRYISAFIHGSLSMTFQYEGNMDQQHISNLQKTEDAQNEQADFFFVLDSQYPDLLGIPRDLRIEISPLSFMKFRNLTLRNLRNVNILDHPKKIQTYSRFDRFKNLHSVPELVRIHSDPAIQSIEFVGPYQTNLEYKLEIESKCAARNIECSFPGSKDLEQFLEDNVYENLVVIPSSFDSFNLVGLEMILCGIPILLSENTGLAHWLKQNYPNLHFDTYSPQKIGSSMNCFERPWADTLEQARINKDFISISQLEAHYSLRELLLAAFSNLTVKVNSKPFIVPDSSRFGLQTKISRVISIFIKLGKPFKLNQSGFKLSRKVSNLFNSSKSRFSTYLRRHPHRLLWAMYIRTIIFPAPTKKSVLANPARYHKNYFYRSYVYLCLGTNLHNKDSLAYLLRYLRLTGSESGLRTNAVRDILNKIPNDRHRNLVLNSFNLDKISDIEITNDGSQNSKENFNYKTLSFFDTKDTPLLSIIVSAYLGASKIETFIKRLALSPEISNREVELIFVDANSPHFDSEVASVWMKNLGLRGLVIRSSRRITIQAAWNEGIRRSKSPHLMFLGLDESIYPDAIRLLINKMNETNADWVMGNSVVTEVDHGGNDLEDIMLYDRSGLDTQLIYLESCYIAHVGGLYKRNLHERFGFYDEDFVGAGDTEFKVRVASFIKTAHVDRTLGIFLNYKEDRTTASSRVEIEDASAWYAKRYALASKSNDLKSDFQFLKKTYSSAKSYRKSYSIHQSTDLLIRYSISKSLVSSSPECQQDLSLSKKLGESFLKINRQKIKKYKRISTKKLLLLSKLLNQNFGYYKQRNYKGLGYLWNDNSNEQHHWLW